MWAVTPIVIANAALGTFLLIGVASATATKHFPLVERKTLDREFRFSIPSVDAYRNGALALRNPNTKIVLNITWASGVIISLLFAIRGDVLNGLLSIAGIVAVWTNTLLPEWNNSIQGSGQDTKTKNMTEFEFLELNVIGENYDQTCVFIQPNAVSNVTKKSILDTKFVTARMYALANAHAAATDFKGMTFMLETYRSAVHDVEKLSDIIIEQTALVIGRLSVELKYVNPRNPSHRLAFTALVAMVLDSEPWDNVQNHRSRLLSLGIAEAWLYKFISASGRLAKDAFPNVEHQTLNCPCPIHRWNLRHELKETAQEEFEYLVGSRVKLPKIFTEDDIEFAQKVWTEIKKRTRDGHQSTSMLLTVYLRALYARGSIDMTDSEYFPVFDLELVPFSENDFSEGCTLALNEENSKGKPLIGKSATDRGLYFEYNSQTNITNYNQRKVMVPFHPKVITHVAIRVLWRAIMAQSAVWVMIALKLLSQ